jgi:hypothetical protein
VASTGDITGVTSPLVVEVFNDVVGENKSSANRIGKCGRKRKDGAALSFNKRKYPAHGADNFLRYQELVKAKSSATSLRGRDEKCSYLHAGKKERKKEIPYKESKMKVIGTHLGCVVV